MVNGVTGYNKGDGSINKLLAAYGNDIVNVDTGLGYGLNLNSANNVEFETFLDRSFFENYSERPLAFNGTSWLSDYTNNMMLSKWIRKYHNRLFLGYCKFPSGQAPQDVNGNAITFPSRVFYSDLSATNSLTWDLSWGQNGSTIGGTNIFQLTGAPTQDFKAANIRVGDPLYITNGNSQLITTKPYTVASVDSPYRLLIQGIFPVTASSLHFWVGGNWFDVGTDDGDYINGFGENNDQSLCFKQFSLYRYNGSSLQKVKNVPGTTSGRSVINIGDYTVYFHGSNSNTRKTGFYVYNGYTSSIISRPVQPFINGIASTNYASVAAWREGTRYRAYVGNITNSPENISVPTAAITWDSEGGQFSIDPLNDLIEGSTKFIESSTEKSFLMGNPDEILESPSGNSYNGASISWAMETGVYYPSSSEVANKYTRLQVVSENASNVQVLYKLVGKPKNDDDQWVSLGDIAHNYEEFVIPQSNNYGRGFNIRFQERGTRTNRQVIKKIAMFYIPQTSSINAIYGNR